MRYQDWDVLIFPGDSHTPQQEFRTACHLHQDSRTHLSTPLVTSFIPSLPPNAPFQVSLHAWNKPVWILGVGNVGYVHGTKYLWQVKVVSDETVVCKREFEEDVVWPVQIASSAVHADGADGAPLLFPRFPRDVMGQTQWHAADERGRIKVYVSAGYNIEVGAAAGTTRPHFVKLIDHVVFSFQPAPIEILQRSGIAWPHPNLPVVHDVFTGYRPSPLTPAMAAFADLEGTLKRRPSHVTFTEVLHEPDGLGSRSTSAYTSYAAHPPLEPYVPPQSLNVRVQSDQLRQIIEALSPMKQAAVVEAAQAVASMSMPPPPLPKHMGEDDGKKTPGLLLQADRHSHATDTGRRAESRYSDVSMHAGCTSFPACISEDTEGRIIHSPTATSPAAVIKGRKEGSSPSKPLPAGRDFLSTVLDGEAPAGSSMTRQIVIDANDTKATAPDKTVRAPASVSSPVDGETPARKRTRSSLKSLSINDGSPEKKERPPRKASKASSNRSTTSEKENMVVDG